MSADDIARSVARWVTRDGAARIHFLEHDYYRLHGRIVHGARASCSERGRSRVRGLPNPPSQDSGCCGAGTHPGGEVSGMPGYNAADALLAAWPDV